MPLILAGLSFLCLWYLQDCHTYALDTCRIVILMSLIFTGLSFVCLSYLQDSLSGRLRSRKRSCWPISRRFELLTGRTRVAPVCLSPPSWCVEEWQGPSPRPSCEYIQEMYVQNSSTNTKLCSFLTNLCTYCLELVWLLSIKLLLNVKTLKKMRGTSFLQIICYYLFFAPRKNETKSLWSTHLRVMCPWTKCHLYFHLNY